MVSEQPFQPREVVGWFPVRGEPLGRNIRAGRKRRAADTISLADSGRHCETGRTGATSPHQPSYKWAPEERSL